MDAIGSQSGPKSAGLNFASDRLMKQLESTLGKFPFLVHIKNSRGHDFEHCSLV